ncbi:hypothetical protein JEQ12_019402 [Ovis aries]|uniref:Uncharacterized protein n=1 Tax=Ovis aries TaxID=9940 RepID=A0A836ABK9_SHEEP|nr:hypothetical protein JEQ12_019402 [Ovis aries]
MAQFVCNVAEKVPTLLTTFWHYAKVELVPPTPAEIPTEVLLNGLVVTEVWMWFYIGKIIYFRQAW